MYISTFPPGSRAYWHDIATNGKEILQAPISIHWPTGVELEDLEFQNIGIRQMCWLHSMGRNILLADEMGLGKTNQACGFINAIKPDKVLIICPNSLKYMWRDKVRELVIKQYEMEVAGSSIFMFSDFVIINYEALKNMGDALKSIHWDLIIADEAHYLKNINALRSQITYGLDSECFLFLTGTPIVNYPYEIFPLIHKLDPTTWPEASGFEWYFCWGSDSKYGRHLDILQRVLRNTIMIRRLKKDVLTDLPQIRRQIIEIQATPEIQKILDREKKLYEDKDIMAQLNEAMDDAKNMESDVDFEAIIRDLTATKSFLFEEMSRIRHLIGLAKIPYVIEHLENTLQNDNKIVVFGHHHDVIQPLSKRFARGTTDAIANGKNHYSTYIDGSITDMEDRYNRWKKQFQEDDNCRLICVGMKAAGVGIDLTASSHAIFAEVDWVPGTLNQAEARLHRIGQDANKILCQYMIFADSMDSTMLRKVHRKMQSINKALNK